KKSKKIIKNGNTRKKQKKETRKKKKIVKKSDKIMIKKNKIEVNETVIVNENSDKNLEKTGWWSK
ncbi:MAG: hypothetical protein HVK45_06130, partial [Pelagibacteraceae bacterium]|nr:hypothetical protein [Pelagibacteraceae bacterium]